MSLSNATENQVVAGQIGGGFGLLAVLLAQCSK